MTDDERATILAFQEKVTSIRANLATARETLLNTFRKALEGLED